MKTTRLAALLLAAALAAPATAETLATPAARVSLDLAVSGFNGGYSSPGATMAPVVRGPLTLRLTAPENSVVVTANRLRLARLDDGTDRVEWSADFSGRARIIADYELAGVPGRLEDEVTVPAQSRTVAGRVRLARDQAGYAVTIVALPPTVEVAIQSRLAGQLGSACDTMSILPLVSLDCGGIRAAMSTASVPLPKAGEVYLLPDARLSAEERRLLDAYLGGPK